MLMNQTRSWKGKPFGNESNRKITHLSRFPFRSLGMGTQSIKVVAGRECRIVQCLFKWFSYVAPFFYQSFFFFPFIFFEKGNFSFYYTRGRDIIFFFFTYFIDVYMYNRNYQVFSCNLRLSSMVVIMINQGLRLFLLMAPNLDRSSVETQKLGTLNAVCWNPFHL